MEGKQLQSLINLALDNAKLEQVSTDVSGQTINIRMWAANRMNGPSTGGVKKRDVKGFIKFDDNTVFGPTAIATVLDIDKYAVITVAVPSKTPIAAFFTWSEEIGGVTVRRSASFNRDSKYIGEVWNSTIIFWECLPLKEDWYEYAGGGIVYSS